MQDRFKFRIWSKSEKKMMLFNNPVLIDGDVFQGGLLFKNYDHKIINCHEVNPKDLILMQCTGLKDKNGELIYEKDIIRFYFDDDEIIAVVEWDNDECRFYLNTTDYFKDKYVTDYEIVKQEEYEVIGNVHENPELLEVQNG